MSSWVQAAWVVQRIIEELEIPSKIDSYIEKLDEAEEKLAKLDETLGKQTIKTAVEISSVIEAIDGKISQIMDVKKFSFLDTPSQTNNQQPAHANLNTIEKDSIWFVCESIYTTASEGQGEQNNGNE